MKNDQINRHKKYTYIIIMKLLQCFDYAGSPCQVKNSKNYKTIKLIIIKENNNNITIKNNKQPECQKE